MDGPKGDQNSAHSLRSETSHVDSQQTRPFLRRLSSGLSAIVPNFSPAATTPDRPRSVAPRSSRISRQESQGFLHPKRTNTSAPLEPHRPCPYDPTHYHSLPVIEKPSCDFCGLRRVKSASEILFSHRPCKDCRSKTSDSHLRSEYWYTPSRKDLSLNSSITSIYESDLFLDGPRPVSITDAAPRMGNPPRTAALPHIYIWTVSSEDPSSQLLSSPEVYDLIPSWQQKRGQSSSPAPLPLQASTPPKPPPSSSPSPSNNPFRPTSPRYRPNNERPSRSPTPTRPKLHFMHGFPHSSSHPFIHKREVSQYFPPPGLVHADTTSTEPRPETDESPSELPCSTCIDQTPSVGGLRLELRGGSPDQSQRNAVRLRGGSGGGESGSATATGTSEPNKNGNENANAHEQNNWFKLKKWLLVCYKPCQSEDDIDTDSDAELPPAKTSGDDGRVRQKKKKECECGRVPLPRNISRGGGNGGHVVAEKRSSSNGGKGNGDENDTVPPPLIVLMGR